MQNKKEVVWYLVVAIVVIALIAIFIYFNQPKTAGAPGKYDTFAQCVAEKGLTMYGAVWCAHCTNEKKAFGDSFKYVPYVECPDNIKLCTDLGINGYPTWIDARGNKYEGE